MTEVLTLGDVAREMRVSIHTVRDWRRKGILKVYKLPTGGVRVLRADVDALLTPVRATKEGDAG